MLQLGAPPKNLKASLVKQNCKKLLTTQIQLSLNYWFYFLEQETKGFAKTLCFDKSFNLFNWFLSLPTSQRQFYV